jgi:hypothetical protein
MNSPFIIDTNALVGWWYYWYPPDQHDFWIAFERYAQSAANRILVPEEVCEEVTTRFPELDEWLSPRKELLMCPNSDDVDAQVRRLVNTYQQRLKLTAFENNADLHVIATAALHQGWVFTDEREARRRRDTGEVEGKYRIPDMCNRESIV